MASAASRLPLLAVKNLRVVFDTDEGTVKAIDGLDFSLPQGRTLGVVGESGCGKSVAARTILRIEDPNCRIAEGSITFRQRGAALELLSLPQNSRELRSMRGAGIALIFQEPMTSFSPVHTIGNQISEPLLLHSRISKAAAWERAVQQLSDVGIAHPEAVMDLYPWQISGGQRQRAMIAMALICGPSVLIADEPTTALDVTTQAQVLELLRTEQEVRSMGMILIAHDLGVVAEAADEVIIMYLGKVVEQGPVDAILNDPLHPYTQCLIRSMPSVRTKARSRIPVLAGSVPHPLKRPSGCPFHPRCPVAIAGECDRNAPLPSVLQDQRIVSCHRYPPDSGHEPLSATGA
jgi:oligopeptide/dipeptide ABC transporter ATP-binding protein